MNFFVVATLALALFVLFMFFDYIFIVTEHIYSLISNRPLYVHYYFNIKKLPPSQFYVLKNNFSFYNTLSKQEKKYFEHRVAKFIEKYQFVGKEGFLVTDEVKVLVASTSIMLTFGMRNYLFEIIDKVILYPSVYYSIANDAYHKGEFHPRMKAIVFSWEDFETGFETTNDNLNLGIHEFTHVLHFHSMTSEDASAVIFNRKYKQIQKEISYPINKEKLISSSYFRIYAYTNQFEFLAVILEHYFESPQLFNQEFPQLYKNVSLMLNHRH